MDRIKKINVLILGSGGREHAFVKALCRDPGVDKLYCAPGNGGTEPEAVNVPLNILDNAAVLDFVKRQDIDFTIVGPEAPLANGLVDFLQAAGKGVFGPTKLASRLESSKLFTRRLLEKHGVPQPRYIACENAAQVRSAADKLGFPLVLKADGLAAGKGVFICGSPAEFESALHELLKGSMSAAAGRISVEECLTGEELSVFAVCDGTRHILLNSAQDHKRVFDGDRGPNTGGMGAYSPTPLSTPKLMDQVSAEIISPVLQAMRQEGCPFTGILYAGLMIVNSRPFVIEFNVRMGDPEAQVVLPLLESSLLELCLAAAGGDLRGTRVRVSPKTAVTVVLASGGYPGVYKKGFPVQGLESVPDAQLCHAGTLRKDDTVVTNGGRVLNAVGFGSDLKSAIRNAYEIVDKIEFKGKFYRSDIGQRGLNYLKENQND
ncbi:MAG: phosphoribosylamine--glycine ligase [FCB group bacterium]|nr:phosphoribosylamine--glycine ligase [FCB group bacterium]